VSSHAVHQHRIAGLEFSGGIFTNITHDHLDYHQTFDAYIKAKKSFFDLLSSDAFAISNFDDPRGEVMLQNTKARKYYYSLKSITDFKGKILLKNNVQGQSYCQVKMTYPAGVYFIRVRFENYLSETVFETLKVIIHN